MIRGSPFVSERLTEWVHEMFLYIPGELLWALAVVSILNYYSTSHQYRTQGGTDGLICNHGVWLLRRRLTLSELRQVRLERVRNVLILRFFN